MKIKIKKVNPEIETMKTLQDSINLIQDWRKAFGLKTDGNGTEEEINLANKLIAEELDELKMASKEDNTVEIIDAFGDLVFVLVQKIDMYNDASDMSIYDEYAMFGWDIISEIEDSIKDDIVENIGDVIVFIKRILSENLNIDLYDLIEEIYKSNMSKLCKDKLTAVRTYNNYNRNGIKASYNVCPTDPTKFIVYRDEDNKVLKSIDFVKPNIAKFLK